MKKARLRQRPQRRATITSETPLPEPDAVSDADIDADEPETGPLRRCAVTRERQAKDAMIRFVLAPEDGGKRPVVPDLAATLPGRGIWLSARGDVIEAAVSRGVFARAARGPVAVPQGLTSVLQASLARRIGESLGLARRAGQAVSGFQKAREWLDAGRVGVVMEASDGSPAERERFLGRHAAQVTLVTPLDGTTMGAIFGRDQAVHVVVAKGRLAERIGHDSQRLAGLALRIGVQSGAKTKESRRKPSVQDEQTSPARSDRVNSRMQAGK
jgi:hypothetical protein